MVTKTPEVVFRIETEMHDNFYHISDGFVVRIVEQVDIQPDYFLSIFPSFNEIPGSP